MLVNLAEEVRWYVVYWTHWETQRISENFCRCGWCSGDLSVQRIKLKHRWSSSLCCRLGFQISTISCEYLFRWRCILPHTVCTSSFLLVSLSSRFSIFWTTYHDIVVIYVSVLWFWSFSHIWKLVFLFPPLVGLRFRFRKWKWKWKV